MVRGVGCSLDNIGVFDPKSTGFGFWTFSQFLNRIALAFSVGNFDSNDICHSIRVLCLYKAPLTSLLDGFQKAVIRC